MKNAAGAPWACSVSPFIDAGVSSGVDGWQGPQLSPRAPVPIDRVARCEECFAYISSFSEFTKRFVHCEGALQGGGGMAWGDRGTGKGLERVTRLACLFWSGGLLRLTWQVEQQSWSRESRP